MLKIVAVNTVLTGSTGSIMRNICEQAEQHGCRTWTATSYRRKKLITFTPRKNDIIIGNVLSLYGHLALGGMTGYKGCFSLLATLKLIRKLKSIRPDIVHLHNLHDSYINLPVLFRYIKKHQIKVIWTLHDCWAFTGQCPYFDRVQCGKWKTGCHHCPQIHEYPKAKTDRTKTMWRLKRKWFTGVQNMTLVTPSQWLAGLVQQSYLKDYPIKVIHNGIDLDVFQPRESDFRARYHVAEQYIILGVAFDWGTRKGLDVFTELASRLDSRFRIVLVGTDEAVDRLLPAQIISIHKTHDQLELAEIYSAADLFVNPTREDNYPTVNMEAIACGTPVLTFRTGGSPEIPDETTGYAVDTDDIDAMEQMIVKICTEQPFTREACLDRAKAFDRNTKFEEYTALYQ